MNLTSRRSPLSGLSFSLFFFLRRKNAEKEKEVIGGAVGKSLLKVTLLTSGKAEPYMISRGNFWGIKVGNFRGKTGESDGTTKP